MSCSAADASSSQRRHQSARARCSAAELSWGRFSRFTLVRFLQAGAVHFHAVGRHSHLVLDAERHREAVADTHDFAAQDATVTQHQDAWLRCELGRIGLTDAADAQDQNGTGAKRAIVNMP